MLECSVSRNLELQWLTASGRIDSMTSPDIQQCLNELILGGERLLVVDLEAVNYISSAGLRIFLGAQKQLKKIGGEMLLHRPSENVLRVFQASGLIQIFRSFASPEAVQAAIEAERAAVAVESRLVRGIQMQCLSRAADPASLVVFGTQEPLALSRYTERDVVTVRPEAIRFGTGLAALGESYEDYRHLFGESVIVDGNFYFYPAVKRPAVDYMLRSEQDMGFEYRFLHGFGFNGGYRHIVSFEGAEGGVELSRLVDALLEISSASVFGLVFLAESKGLWGMHLRRTPIAENAPANGRPIFDAPNFPEWVNFPVEPSDVNSVVVGVGIALREREGGGGGAWAAARRLVSEGSRFHIHGAVFAKEPPSKKVERFESELQRILTELEVHRVQHLLGQSVFSSGIAGIVELEG